MTNSNSVLTVTGSSTASEALSEVKEYLSVSQQRRRLFPRIVLVGLGAGVIAVSFRALLTGADILRTALVVWAQQYVLLGWLLPMLFGAVCAMLSVLLVRRYAPETSGSGIPHLKATLHRLRELRWWRVLPVKMAGGALALGSGMALGREGPTVQMSGAVGDAIARWLKVPARDRL